MNHYKIKSEMRRWFVRKGSALYCFCSYTTEALKNWISIQFPFLLINPELKHSAEMQRKSLKIKETLCSTAASICQH